MKALALLSFLISLVVFTPIESKAREVDSVQFLKSFQQAKRSQRGIFIAVDTAASETIGLGRNIFTKTLDLISDYTGKALIEPWVSVAYHHVEWSMGQSVGDSHSNQYQSISKKWKDLLRKNPTVDYVVFGHTGDENIYAEPLYDLNLRENQLRFAYTTGCYTKGNTKMLTDHYATVAIGHYGLSKSPFIAPLLVQNWTYGLSAYSAAYAAWRNQGHKVKNLQKFLGEYDADQATEPWIAYPTNIDPKKVNISSRTGGRLLSTTYGERWSSGRYRRYLGGQMARSVQISELPITASELR